MAITYPLAFPSQCVKEITIRAKTIVGFSASPFTGQQQVYKHQGQWWEAEMSFPPMRRENAEEVAAFLIKLNGRYGTFLMGDPANTSPRGLATGTPRVKGAGQTGNELITDGWTINTTNILMAGDWIQLGAGATSRLHKVLDNVNSDGTGTATLTLFPSLRSIPADNAVIVITNTVGQWRLSTNDIDYTIQTGQFYGITLACMEAL
jgi:hypothetical protein